MISSRSDDMLSNHNQSSDEREDKELQRLLSPICFGEEAEPLFKSGLN
jgi:hypothetical protein